MRCSALGAQGSRPAQRPRAPLRLPFLLSTALAAAAQTPAEPPRTWIDADTGHRIVRLTDEPGSASLYFNQNGYTADGHKLIIPRRKASPYSIWRPTQAIRLSKDACASSSPGVKRARSIT